jgi:tRNA-2-methylthio-N6-dimethylallyladenosine synthase
MNRYYTRERYLELVHYAQSKIPNVDLTTDIIVGFPGETYEEFLDTLSLVKEVKYGSMFTFIYSPRKGTPAAVMPDPATKEEKSKWFQELLKVQEQIAEGRI